jgi:hypothetical protein
VRCAVKLTNIHNIVFIFENGGLVIVHIEIVGSREYGHDGREAGSLAFSVHSVSSILSFVCSDY